MAINWSVATNWSVYPNQFTKQHGLVVFFTAHIDYVSILQVFTFLSLEIRFKYLAAPGLNCDEIRFEFDQLFKSWRFGHYHEPFGLRPAPPHTELGINYH